MANIYSVSQVNSYISNMFAQDYMLGLISIRGEISNLKYHSTGHIYFTLKDEGAAISCVMFAGNRNGLNFAMQDGQRIVASGQVKVYERDGKYQLYARTIKLDGAGSLAEEFERLKARLEEMGMFANEYKQPIPDYIKTLGVVTAPTGAAIRDIINVSKRRNPYIKIVLYPALVQGERAPESIIKGIEALERYGADTIIIGRGGGSMEDLWAFNDEKVAEAIFNCSIPIISAVGHETDFTIADFVSDLRAPTPSAAAELAVSSYYDLEARVIGYSESLDKAWNSKLTNYKYRLEVLRGKLKATSPESGLAVNKKRLEQLEVLLDSLMDRKLTASRNKLGILAEKLRGLSPLDKLSQGYSYVSDEAGRTVNDVDKVTEGDNLSIYVKNGTISARVTEVNKHG